jgi:hypothetical protein
MEQYNDPLPRETQDTMFASWLSVVRRRECASVLALPKSDRLYRAAQFTEWFGANRRDEVQVRTVSLQSFVTELWDECATKLNRLRATGKQTVFLIVDADWLLYAAPHFIPLFQSYVLAPYRSTSFIFFFEKNILGPQYFNLFRNEPLFNQNILYRPLYSKSDILHFQRHLARLYGTKPADSEMEAIWRECGGYIWLATEALRHMHETGTVSFSHEAFLYRLRSVWEGFDRDERIALEQIVKNIPMRRNYSEIYDYLGKNGLIRTRGPGYEITVPVLAGYIRSQLREQFTLRLDPDGKLTLGTVSVESAFSHKEIRLLRYLLKHTGAIVPRSEVAKLLWGDGAESTYSDWNLDQAVRRIRVRLQALGIDDDVIRTRKGEGLYVAN